VSAIPKVESDGYSSSRYTCSVERLDEEAWRGLRRQMSPDLAFLCGGWIGAWAENYLPYQRWRGPCRYLCVRDNKDRLLAVLPLARMRFGPVEFAACGGYYFPYRGMSLGVPIDASSTVCATLADTLTNHRSWQLGLRIGPVPDRGGSTRLLCSALRQRGWRVGTRPLGSCFILELPQSVAEFSYTAGGMIKRADYYARRMARAGQFEVNQFQVHDAGQWRSLICDVARVERNSWPAQTPDGHLLFATEADRRFWTGVVEDEFFASALAVWLIRLDGEPASFAVTLDAGETKFVLANLYDERFKDHRTGNILARNVITRAIEQGRKVLDWGLGDSGYKRLWGARPGRHIYDVLALPPGPIGGLLKIGLQRYSSFDFEQ
jgi:hypothetical protein